MLYRYGLLASLVCFGLGLGVCWGNGIFQAIPDPAAWQPYTWGGGVLTLVSGLALLVLLSKWARLHLGLWVPAWLWVPHQRRIFRKNPTRLEYGWVYVMQNTPGVVKIGTTQVHPRVRAQQLYTTGVSAPFRVLYQYRTGYAHRVERQAHRLLDACRIDPKREFFSCTPKMAIRAIRAARAQVRATRALSR